MRDDEPELPSGRLLMIMEAHERLKERKRKGIRVHENVDPKASPEVKQMVEHVHAALEPKPRLEAIIKPKTKRLPKGKDYAEVLRRIGRPATPKEIADRAGVTQPSVTMWLYRYGADAGIQICGTRPNKHGRPSNLYTIVQPTSKT